MPDSLLYSSCYLHREDFNIELAYLNFCERIGTIRTACYDKVIKLEELRIVFTTKTNFRYDLFKDYKANRAKYATEESIELSKHTKQLKRLIYDRLRPICEASNIFEADDIVVRYSAKGWMVASIDKDVINASLTPCFNFKTGKWITASTQEEIDRWYLIQSIAGDTSDGISGCKGYGMVKATKFVDELLLGNKTYEDYVNLFDTNEHCLLTNNLVRMNQWDDRGNLKLLIMEELLEGITGF